MLTGRQLQDEIEFVKRQVAAISSQKPKYPSDFVPPQGQWPKRAYIFDIPLAPPPDPTTESDNGAKDVPISLTLKALKPPLSFVLKDCEGTAPISTLKARLSEQENGVPPAANQRWLYKGKVIADNKLLREYDTIKDGDVLTLMATGGATISASTPKDANAMDVDSDPSASTSRGSIPTPIITNVPTFSLSSTPASPAVPISSTDIIQNSTPPSPAITPSVPHTLLSRFQDPEFWIQSYDFLLKQFTPKAGEEELDGESERNAVTVWEQWLESGKVWLTPSDIAKIRDRTGISSMGGI